MLGALCLAWTLALGLSYPQSHGRNLNSTGRWHHLGSPVPLNNTGRHAHFTLSIWTPSWTGCTLYISWSDRSDLPIAQRCADEEGFDAVTLDETGTMLFFKGDFVWKGFTSSAEPINTSWPEIQGPVDAALRIHNLDHPDTHNNVYLFQGKRVWAYAHSKLRGGYPRLIKDEFKGVPGDLDAAVECHPKECAEETILFFKGSQVLSYELKTGVLKERLWPAVANCSASVRWLEHYYCFQGIWFLRFDPITGSVPPRYPLDARDYFMRCPGRGHGRTVQQNATLRAAYNRCSGQPFQAFSSDDSGRIYAFRGGLYFRVDSHRDGWHAWPLSHTWKDIQGEVNAAFSWEDKLYLIQGSQVTIFLSGRGYSRVEGYPRALREELGMASIDAAFTCPHSQDLYLFQGNLVQHVDLLQGSKGPSRAQTIPHAHVDGALCTPQGVYLFQGTSFYHYTSVDELLHATVPAAAQDTATTFFQCPATGGTQRPPHKG